MEPNVQPLNALKWQYFYIVPLALLLNLIAVLFLMRGHLYRIVSMPDNMSSPILADWLYRALPHPAQMHGHAAMSRQLDIWSAEFTKFTGFMAIQLAFTLFIFGHIAVYYLFGYARKAELALIEEYRNPTSIRKPLKSSAAFKAVGVVMGFIIFTVYYLYLVPYNGTEYDEQFFSDLLMCCFLLIWVILLGAITRNALISRRAVLKGPLLVPARYVPAPGIVGDENNNLIG